MLETLEGGEYTERANIPCIAKSSPSSCELCPPPPFRNGWLEWNEQAMKWMSNEMAGRNEMNKQWNGWLEWNEWAMKCLAGMKWTSNEMAGWNEMKELMKWLARMKWLAEMKWTSNEMAGWNEMNEQWNGWLEWNERAMKWLAGMKWTSNEMAGWNEIWNGWLEWNERTNEMAG